MGNTRPIWWRCFSPISICADLVDYLRLFLRRGPVKSVVAEFVAYTLGKGPAEGVATAAEGSFRLYRSHRPGRQDVYVARYPVGVPNL